MQFASQSCQIIPIANHILHQFSSRNFEKHDLSTTTSKTTKLATKTEYFIRSDNLVSNVGELPILGKSRHTIPFIIHFQVCSATPIVVKRVELFAV